MLSNRLQKRLRIGWLVPRWFRKLILWSICRGDEEEVVLIWQSRVHLRWATSAEMSRECSRVLVCVNYADAESAAVTVVDMSRPRKWMTWVRISSLLSRPWMKIKRPKINLSIQMHSQSMIDFSSVRFVSFPPSMYPNEMKIKDELSLSLFVFGQTSGIHEKR